MSLRGFALFDTPIGRCGIAWGPGGVAGVQLPEAREAATRARLARRFPDATLAPPPPGVADAIAAIGALLRGERVELRTIALDMAGVPAFHRRVYDVARAIPPGTTLTYGEVAARAGAPGAARAVGQALGRNPFAIVVPCHRVLAAGGRVGGFSANGGVHTKLKLLALERAATPPGFDGDGALGFDPDAAVAHLRAVDRALARLVDAVGPLRLQLRRSTSLFLALAEAIVHQQLSGQAAATIFGRLCALSPRAHEGPTPAQLLRVPDARLRAAGLSAAKTLALRDLARRADDRRLPTLAEAQRLDDATLIDRLTAVRGIGRWTVEMLLIFRLGRPDVLPVDDLGVRAGARVVHGLATLPSPRELAALGAPWAPFRTAASWYLWRAAERGGL
jgi:O-6-methylguanine DNA methyltransferase